MTPNREDIIRMAREAGWSGLYTTYNEPTGNADWQMVKESLTVPVTMEQIERFAALVAAHVRETEFKPDWNNYQRGVADGAAAEREAKEELLAALQDLLMDTQHAEHECGDKNCPVARAVEVALKYDTRGQA